MIERAKYYIDLFISLCGFDGNNDSAIFGWTVVTVATIIVIYAFYEAITKVIWPGEKNADHIKYQILNSDWQDEVEIGEIERAY